MVLHHDGHTHIYRHDGLSPLSDIASRHGEERFREHPDPNGIYDKPVAETFDAIVTNPPFSISLDNQTRGRLTATFDLAGTANSENLFLERWYQLLVHGGRLAAVLPESFYSTAENLAARLFLFAHFNIKAIVSLPPIAFQPWTPTRTSLLFAQKKTSGEEAAWKKAFEEGLGAAKEEHKETDSALRRIRTPRAKTTKEQLDESRTRVRAGLEKLGVILGSDVDLGTTAGLEKARHALSSVSVESLAFGNTIDKVALYADYEGIIVANIGYRRTRRGESDRRNDLFQAELTADGVTRTIRNLNDMS